MKQRQQKHDVRQETKRKETNKTEGCPMGNKKNRWMSNMKQREQMDVKQKTKRTDGCQFLYIKKAGRKTTHLKLWQKIPKRN